MRIGGVWSLRIITSYLWT